MRAGVYDNWCAAVKWTVRYVQYFRLRGYEMKILKCILYFRILVIHLMQTTPIAKIC